jgi:hypothetical protein
MLPRLTLNSWVQVILLPQPLKCLGLQDHVSVLAYLEILQCYVLH